MIELAFDIQAVQKEDKSIEHYVFNEKWRLPKSTVVRVYDIKKAGPPLMYYIESVSQPQPGAQTYKHRLLPLPVQEYVGHG